jgi:hypothetical protein
MAVKTTKRTPKNRLTDTRREGNHHWYDIGDGVVNALTQRIDAGDDGVGTATTTNRSVVQLQSAKRFATPQISKIPVKVLQKMVKWLRIMLW